MHAVRKISLVFMLELHNDDEKNGYGRADGKRRGVVRNAHSMGERRRTALIVFASSTVPRRA
jgi:hypothetical protein